MVEGDVFREVEEDMRRERMRELWDRFGVYVIGVACAVVLLVAGNAMYSNYAAGVASDASEQFLNANQTLDEDGASEGAVTEAEEALATLSKSGPGGYRPLAQFRLAGAKQAEGDNEGARTLLDEIADNRNVDVTLRDLARIRAAMVSLALDDFTGVENRLTDMTGFESPWRHTARELVGLAALEAGNTERAQTILSEAIIDTETPPSLRQRAQSYLELVMQTDVKAPESTPSQAAADGGASDGAQATTSESEVGEGDATTN